MNKKTEIPTQGGSDPLELEDEITSPESKDVESPEVDVLADIIDEDEERFVAQSIEGATTEKTMDDIIDEDGGFLPASEDDDDDEVVTPRIYPKWEDAEVKTGIADDEIIPSNVYIPDDFSADVQKRFSEVIGLDIKDNPETRDWIEIVTEAQKVEPRDERFQRTLEQGHWRKAIENDGEALTHGTQSLNHIANVKISGMEAKRRAQVYMGGGTYYSTPCWASGIWLKMNPVGELELLELYREIVSTKINLGHYTYGAVFSSVSGYAVESIIKFIIRNLSQTSLKYESVDDILESLKITDLQGIIAGLNEMLYSSNLQYSTACTADPNKCTHVTVGKLNVSSLIRTNEEAIPERLRRFMGKTRLKKNVVTQKQLEGYEAELLVKKQKTFTIELGGDKTIEIHMKVPSIADYLRGSHAWIDGIKTMIEEAVVKPKDDEERNRFVSDAALASSLRQYSHFIDYIVFGDNLEVHAQEDIEEILTTYTSNNQIRARIVEEVNKFIDDTTLTVVGIKAFVCPNCGARQGDEAVSIIPLEQLELFIRSLGTKCAEIRRRK